MTKITRFIPILLALSSFNSYASTHWTKMLQEDLSYIRDSATNNHPGYLDNQNPEFKAWLDHGYEKALEQAEQVNSLEELMSVTSEYIAGFADGHFGLSFNYSPKYMKWVGIQMKKIGRDYKVIYADENHGSIMPPNLSKLVECDGLPVDEIMNEHLLRVRFNAPTMNFPKARFAEKLLLDDGIGKRQHFEACTFELDGKTHNVKLAWRNISALSYSKLVKRTRQKPEFRFEETAKNQYWVSLPTFQTSQAQAEQLNEILNQIKAKASGADQFVIDVRGNGGGNSEWGVAVAKAIYGEQFITEHQLFNPDKSYAEWRVSKDNLNYIKSILPEVKAQFGEHNTLFLDLQKVATNMQNAMRDGLPFVTQRSETNYPIRAQDMKAKAVSKASVLFLTDRSCGSACLDFADLILELPNVTHIGEETAADTLYMDIRIEHLPSGLGIFSLAQKVYRDRARGHNQSYLPKIAYLGDLSNTEQVKRWVSSLKTTSL